jgi:peptidoglycan/xylan/chitin deacetylase (PgdA/CDA1 family)
VLRWIRYGVVGVFGLGLLLGVTYAGMVISRWARFRNQDCRVTPLMYHDVIPSNRRAARYWVREAEFGRQMDALKAAGAVTPPLDSVVAWLQRPAGDCPFPPNAVMITFDLDGSSHHAELALPHLLRNGFQAVFFIPVMWLDHPPGVTSDGVRALAAAGMIVGSHTEHHYDMREEQPDSMVASLQRTQVRLGAVSGQSISTISAPGGRYNEAVVAGVERAGFTSFFTSDPCYLTPETTPHRLCRIEVRGDGGMTALGALQGPWPVAVQATDWAIKRRVEAIVGGRLWFLLHVLRSEADGPGY